MGKTYSLNLQAKQKQTLKQMQRLIMSPQMQQAISLLQMPILELSNCLETELAENPVLENEIESDEEESIDEVENLEEDSFLEEELNFNERDLELLKRLDDDFQDHFTQNDISIKRTSEEEKLKTFLESSLPSYQTLHEHLLQQAREIFKNEEELAMAEVIIGNLNHSGFFQEPLSELALFHHFDEEKLSNILQQIQGFDPSGIAAYDNRESFLLQLKMSNQHETLAYRILSDCYEDFLYNHRNHIQRKLKCSLEEINDAVDNVIAKLNMHPGNSFEKVVAQPIIPDATILQEGEDLQVQVNEDPLPQIRFNRRYLQMLEDSTIPLETRDFIKQKIQSAQWFMQNVHQRHLTIENIARILARIQKDFFTNPEGKLVPLTMKTVAEELGLNESTVARAVSNKYLNSPRGLCSFRFFFTNGYMTKEGDNISSNTVRLKLLSIIENENKAKPLSDEAISLLLQAQGIVCARRTVAKYRTALQIGNAQQRKKF